MTPQKLNLDVNQYIIEEKVFFIFMMDFIDNHKINIEIPRNSIGRAIDLSFVDHQILDLFENKSLYDMLQYYKNYYNFKGN